MVHKDQEFQEITHRAKHHAGHGALHAMQGHPGMLVAVAGGWLIGKAVHVLAKPWTCLACDHRFS
ncbi:MAG: hypothetical protein M3Y45_06300 [Actinomycetota bacterium]|nr:hypothetical protein [Actinomycetota bacterium]